MEEKPSLPCTQQQPSLPSLPTTSHPPFSSPSGGGRQGDAHFSAYYHPAFCLFVFVLPWKKNKQKVKTVQTGSSSRGKEKPPSAKNKTSMPSGRTHRHACSRTRLTGAGRAEGEAGQGRDRRGRAGRQWGPLVLLFSILDVMDLSLCVISGDE